MKVCTKCGKSKSLSEFSPRPERPSGYQSACKACRRADVKRRHSERKEEYKQARINKRAGYTPEQLHAEWEMNRRTRIKREYGITVDDFDRMLKKQDGVCAICLQPERQNRKVLSIDHNHKTGAVRGLLCSLCNFGLGALEDNMDRAVLYLERYNT